jgi:hypothetical protein
MKKLFVILCLMGVSFVSMGQLFYNKHLQQSLVIVKHDDPPVHLYLTASPKDRSPKAAATVMYIGLNGIISLNQFTSPKNVQKETLPEYVGTIVLTSVAYVLFLTLK